LYCLYRRPLTFYSPHVSRRILSKFFHPLLLLFSLPSALLYLFSSSINLYPLILPFLIVKFFFQIILRAGKKLQHVIVMLIVKFFFPDYSTRGQKIATCHCNADIGEGENPWVLLGCKVKTTRWTFFVQKTWSAIVVQYFSCILLISFCFFCVFFCRGHILVICCGNDLFYVGNCFFAEGLWQGKKSFN
jgi:hypothetical protein